MKGFDSLTKEMGKVRKLLACVSMTVLAAGAAGASAQTAASAPSTAGNAVQITAARQVPIENFFQRPALRQAVLSPSGKRLAAISGLGAPRDGLVVVELTDPIKVSRVAQFNDADVSSFRWVNDERLVFSVTDQTAGSGEDYRTGQGLYATKVDGSEGRVLINRVGLSSAAGPARREGALGSDHILLKVVDTSGDSALKTDEIITGRVTIHGMESRRDRWGGSGLHGAGGAERRLDPGAST